jgi:hypothetical protein
VIERLKAKLLKRGAYKDVFGTSVETWTPAQQRVMRDLADYCNAYRTTALRVPDGPQDPIASAIAEGRRQVYLRIVALSQLPDSAILQAIEREQHND